MEILSYFTDLSTISIILFLVGIILMIVEMFTPGFGLAGLSGLIILIFDVIYSANSFKQGFWLMLFVMIILAIIFIIFLYLISHDKLPNHLILKEKTSTSSGFISNDEQTDLVGLIGTTITELRPAGIAMINDKRIDVVSHGDYIERKKKVRVINVKGNRIIVKEIKEDII
ncbi:MAG: NfeD family protein [Erysipelotrichaceae bacterium]|nr:NfeD family protein [Erysipelotrichaceae bacterium]